MRKNKAQDQPLTGGHCSDRGVLGLGDARSSPPKDLEPANHVSLYRHSRQALIFLARIHIILPHDAPLFYAINAV